MQWFNASMEWLIGLWAMIPSFVQVTILVVAVMMTIIMAVAFLTLAERKVIGYMQLRLGPNRVTFFGLRVFRGIAQPFADVFKLLLKEIIVPTASSRFLFLLAPLIVLVPALAAWAVIPFSPEFVLAELRHTAAGVVYDGRFAGGHAFGAEPGGTTTELAIYRVDAIVRRATALQMTRAGRAAAGTG